MWPASCLPMPMENTGYYADILIFANANVALYFVKNSRRRVVCKIPLLARRTGRPSAARDDRVSCIQAGGCLFYGQINNTQ